MQKYTFINYITLLRQTTKITVQELALSLYFGLKGDFVSGIFGCVVVVTDTWGGVILILSPTPTSSHYIFY